MFDDVLDGIEYSEVKKLKKNYVVFILDESGSMYGKNSFILSTLREQLEEISKQTEFDTEVYIRKFNSTVGKLDKVKLENYNNYITTKLKYAPSGLTALYDAVGLTVQKFDEITDPVLMVVITDGYENNSKEFTSAVLQELTQSKQVENNWTIVYLGSDHDIHKQSHDVTCYATNTMSFDSDEDGYKTMSRDLRSATCSYYSAGANKTTNFFDNKTGSKK